MTRKYQARALACRFCGVSLKELQLRGYNGETLCAHIPYCHENPNREKTIQALVKRKLGRSCRKDVKEKIRSTINKKVASGKWHFSFSRSRTYLYKGIKLYGTWELNYAKWLDSHNIKWSRPTRKFPYVFNGVLRHYTPDFFLEDTGCFVEIKGYETEKDRAKWEQFTERLVVLSGQKLFNLGIIDSYKRLINM